MTPMNRLLTLVLAALLFAVAGPARAQGLTIDIVNGNPSAIPIAVVPFAWRAPACRRRPTSPRSSAPT